MDEEGIIKNIRRLSTYIDIAYLKSEDEKFSTFESDFTVFKKQLEIIYAKWFPKSRAIRDEEVINIIFVDVDSKNAKNWVKYSLHCLINSSQRVYDNIKRFKDLPDKQILICEMDLLNEISFEAAIFLQTAFEIIEKKNVDFGHYKRRTIHARETYNASVQILRKFTSKRTLGDFVLGPTSIFLIRQSIELWLFDIFNIDILLDQNGKPIKLQPEKLFNLIDNKGLKVKLPVSKSAIQKIHTWTQVYVHKGWLTYIWEIEHAQHVLAPIYNISSIDIDSEYYDSVPNLLRKLLGNETYKIVRYKGNERVLQ